MSTDTAVEDLREAATLMRVRANAATPGPWTSECIGSEGYQVYGPAREHRRAVPAMVFRGSHEDCRDNAEYIAAMHPYVAMAISRWLDGLATSIAMGPNHDAYPVAAEINNGLSVARTYLGDAS